MYPKHYFDLFNPDIKQGLVFIGMSFNPAEQFKWTDIIEPALKKVNLTGYRVDMNDINDSILVDIMNGIKNSQILIFDISADDDGRRNENVMYELGIAHAIRLPEEVLIIRSDNIHRIHFDISNIRVHKYDASKIEESIESINSITTNMVSSINKNKQLAVDKVISLFDETAASFCYYKANSEVIALKDAANAYSLETIENRNAIRRLLELGMLMFLLVTVD